MKSEILVKLIEMLVSSDSVSNDATNKEDEHKGRYIVIGNRGNTVVGDLYDIGGNNRLLKNASVIRRWGTSKGLGQLALEGAQAETKLDECGEFEFDITTTCGLIKVTSNL